MCVFVVVVAAAVTFHPVAWLLFCIYLVERHPQQAERYILAASCGLSMHFLRSFE